MVPLRSRSTIASGSASGPSATASVPLCSSIRAPERLAERLRRLRQLLEEEVRELAPVDVAGRDRRGAEVAVTYRQRRAVVREATDPLHRARTGAVQHDDLARRATLRATSRRPCAGRSTSPPPLRRARSPRRRRPRPARRRAPGRCRATPAAPAPGAPGGAGGDGDRSVERRHRLPKRLAEIGLVGEPPGDERGDHLGVGGELRRQPQARRVTQLRVVVDVAVQRRHDVGPVATRPPPGSRGWAFASEMIPTLAHRVWRDHRRLRVVAPERAGAGDRRPRSPAGGRAVLSPSSPISAAAL